MQIRKFQETRKNINDSRGVVKFGTLISALLTFAIVVIVVIGYVVFHRMNIFERKNADTAEQQFASDIQKGGELLTGGNSAEAILHFHRLIEDAETPTQEGIAKLNLGVATLGSNTEEAISLLKEVSVNENYDPFTRAKAVNHILNEYTATSNEAFAREYIFTGHTWGTFLEGAATIDEAVLKAFEFSASLNPTPEAAMRIAVETALLMQEDISEEERNSLAERVLANIASGDAAIASLRDAGRVRYGDTHFTEIATALNRKGIALGVLYFEGHIDDPQEVEGAFQDAINVLIENGGGSGTELFVRYNYADFLLRLDAAGRRESIEKVLAPMSKMTENHNIADFLKNLMSSADSNELDDSRALRINNIVELARISEEFHQALLRIGVDLEI